MREVEDELGRCASVVDAGLHEAGQQVERLGRQAAGLAHAGEGLGAVQLDLAVLALGRSGGVDERHEKPGKIDRS